MSQSGWYRIEARTAEGRKLGSDEVYFDSDYLNSHALSLAHLEGGQTRFTHHGFGEEMPLAQIRVPFEGDHWWYPNNHYWEVAATFDGQTHRLKGGSNAQAAKRFRSSSK